MSSFQSFRTCPGLDSGPKRWGFRLSLAGRQLILAFSLLLTACADSAPEYDLLLRGALVYDGSGSEPRELDVALRGERIAAIGEPGSFDRAGAAETVDLDGLALLPGFIDLHAHVNELDERPMAENFLRQGITTTVNSLHSHDQPDLDQRAELSTALNVVYFAGHTWIRKQVLELENRAPTQAELEQMQDLVRDAMARGAFGLSTGLEYVPATFAQVDEVVALAAAAAESGGLYFTHLRDEGPRLFEAIGEALAVGKAAGTPVHISHLKAAGVAHHGLSAAVLERLAEVRGEGVDVTYDIYPYGAFSTYSDLLFPSWALADGPEALQNRVDDPATRQRMLAEMRTIFPQQTGGGFDTIQFRALEQVPELSGATLADLQRHLDRPLELDAVLETLVDLQLSGGFIGIFHSMSEDDIERFLAEQGAMVNSDGDLVVPGEGHPHPRSYGSFPRVFSRYVARGVLTREEAVHRMTRLPAERLGLSERGRIEEGAFADLIAVDFDDLADRSTYLEPHAFSTGVEDVWVNGRPVMRSGELVAKAGAPESLAGRMLRRPGS